MDNKKVSFQEISKPHCRRTCESMKAGVYLSICDTTEQSFSLKRKIKNLGPVGDGIGQGFFLHTSLIVREESEEIVGLVLKNSFTESHLLQEKVQDSVKNGNANRWYGDKLSTRSCRSLWTGLLQASSVVVVVDES